MGGETGEAGGARPFRFLGKKKTENPNNGLEPIAFDIYIIRNAARRVRLLLELEGKTIANL